MKFTATEAGFKKGMGGASNAKGGGKYHYILFGCQKDGQHPHNSGTYFEYDDQINGAVNSVKEVYIEDKLVSFQLKGGKSIEVNRDVGDAQWKAFIRGIRTVFPPSLERQL